LRLSAAYELGLYDFLAIAGLRWIPREVAALFNSLFFYSILISGGLISEARFRVPIMPLVCIAAGVAMAHWCGNWEQKTAIHKSERSRF